jgi:peptide/nickel transport system permease protein
MVTAIGYRIAQALLVALAITALAFVMFRFAGDPVVMLSTPDMTLDERAQLRETLGLNDPLLVQYGKFLSRIAHGNFGVSFRNQRPVLDLIFQRFPATFELVLVATVLAIGVGIPLGVYSALKPEGWIARTIQTLSFVGISMPTFVTGIALILIFAVWLRWVPSFGRGDVVTVAGWPTGFLTSSGWHALVLPSITLAIYQVTLIMRLVRAEMIDVLSSDYIRFARARGLPDRYVNFHLALRNALMPVVTVVGLQIGGLIAFAIVTETVFQWPGLGLLFMQSVSFTDIPVMSAYLLFVGMLFVILNVAVDLIYCVIDPRLRTGSL